MKNLERDSAIVAEIRREIDRCHSAAAQLAIEVIARDKCRFETLM